MSDRYHTFQGVSFGGVMCAQYWCDFILWESLLNENPEVQAIVELGTWKGGFSQYLYSQAQARELRFRTYDSVASTDCVVPGFYRKDVFKEAEEIGLHLRSWEPLILLCDNGNKPRELKTFPPYMKDPRSLIVVHDWGSEVVPSDVPESLVAVYEEFCDELGSISRVFRLRV